MPSKKRPVSERGPPARCAPLRSTPGLEGPSWEVRGFGVSEIRASEARPLRVLERAETGRGEQVVHDVTRAPSGAVRIGHPTGVMEVDGEARLVLGFVGWVPEARGQFSRVRSSVPCLEVGAADPRAMAYLDLEMLVKQSKLQSPQKFKAPESGPVYQMGNIEQTDRNMLF